MRASRPHLNLHLDLPPIQTGIQTQTPAQPAWQAATDHLLAKQDELRDEMRKMDEFVFRRECNAPTYDDGRLAGFIQEKCGHRLSNPGADAFIHVRRTGGGQPDQYAGDKIHISVRPEQLPAAFSAVAPLLFSMDSPIDSWKVTDMERCSRQSRLYRGAQFTLYIKPQGAECRYEAEGLKKLQDFVQNLETALLESGVPAGRRPDSDVSAPGWQYASYRNEYSSDREGGEAQQRRQREEPFFKLISNSAGPSHPLLERYAQEFTLPFNHKTYENRDLLKTANSAGERAYHLYDRGQNRFVELFNYAGTDNKSNAAEKMGQGAYGGVYARKNPNAHSLVVKHLKEPVPDWERMNQVFLKVKQLPEALQKHFNVPVFASSTKQLLQKVNGLNLFQLYESSDSSMRDKFRHQLPANIFDEGKMRELFHRMNEALTRVDFRHGDIGNQNIMYDVSSDCLVLVDFDAVRAEGHPLSNQADNIKDMNNVERYSLICAAKRRAPSTARTGQ
ncbi:hypothetical protein [Duganella violaceipulchra]|uniref:Protein kinase domain-containing protein n=1 Tax=Duganella violaceipulchra TaxID=2849652 RepID=A0AA41H9P5_9BURK|nr:hypothetical protein [Duganella violaceicalia]MBV6322471.1 hypothetical protein [Duganella violaceicalia]MCP2010676.1 hypothetical protein [Duganella violaceicalia]